MENKIKLTKDMNRKEAINIIKNHSSFQMLREALRILIPELKESEDEKIRRCISDVVRKYGVEFTTGTITKEKMLAWLEKQGEHKAQCNSKKSWVEDKVMKEMFHNIIITNDNTPSSKEIFSVYGKTKEDCLAWLEKQGEQETNMDKQETNTVKPKFKPGDWAFCEGLHPILILDIVNDKYKIEFTDNGSSEFHHIDLIDRHCRLWTIEDAKDGDVLSTNSWTFIFKYQDGGVYHHCAVSTYNDLEISDTSEFHQEYVHPATKEQRDLLFQRLKKMGYKWDAEKKKLIMI